MRLFLSLVLCLTVSTAVAAAGSARTVTDSAGREVTVPARIERVYPAGPPASIFLYVLAPDRMIGWPRAPTPAERAFIAPRHRDLPELGRLAGRGDTANLEVILEARPDIVFDYGTVAPTYVSLAERVQRRTGLPYLLIDGTFSNTAESLRLMGRILDLEARAERLAHYAEETLRQTDAILARVPPEDRPRVYFARGPDGFETGVRGSINTEIIERVGAVNVALAPGQQGVAMVSIEQVLSWNPEIIVTLDEQFYESVWTDPLWQQVDAVENEWVYLAPSLPFGWVDRPPSINRLIGVKWLLQLFYPSVYEKDMRRLAREFYRLFYHLDLTDQQLDTLLTRKEARAR